MFAPITSEDQALPEDVIEDTFQFDTGGGGDDPEFLNELGPRVERGLKNAARDPRRLNNAPNNWVPLIMAIFIPLFAIFLRFFTGSASTISTTTWYFRSISIPICFSC